MANVQQNQEQFASEEMMQFNNLDTLYWAQLLNQLYEEDEDWLSSEQLIKDFKEALEDDKMYWLFKQSMYNSMKWREDKVLSNYNNLVGWFNTLLRGYWKLKQELAS